MRNRIFSVKVTAPGFCEECRGTRTIYRRRLDYGSQLLFTAITLGLWAPGWLALWLASQRQPWRCALCRRETASPSDRAAAPWEGHGFAALASFFWQRTKPAQMSAVRRSAATAQPPVPPAPRAA